MMLKEYLTQTLLSYVNIPLISWPPSITPYIAILAELNQPSPSVPAQPGQALSTCGLQVSGCRLLWEQQNRKVILEVTVPNAPSCTWEMELCRATSGHWVKVWWRRKFWLILGMCWIRNLNWDGTVHTPTGRRKEWFFCTCHNQKMLQSETQMRTIKVVFKLLSMHDGWTRKFWGWGKYR